MKGQPLAYNKDNQEDKEPLFDTVDTLKDTLRIFADMLAGLTVKPEAMRAAALRGYATATDPPTTSSRRACPSAMRTRWWRMRSRPPARVALTWPPCRSTSCAPLMDASKTMCSRCCVAGGLAQCALDAGRHGARWQVRAAARRQTKRRNENGRPQERGRRNPGRQTKRAVRQVTSGENAESPFPGPTLRADCYSSLPARCWAHPTPRRRLGLPIRNSPWRGARISPPTPRRSAACRPDAPGHPSPRLTAAPRWARAQAHRTRPDIRSPD